MPLRRLLLFVVSFFVIFGLGLLISGDRLLATDQAETPGFAADKAQARLPELFAFFCGPMNPQRDPAASSHGEARQSTGQVREVTAHRPFEPRRNGAWPARDANGNVLQQGRYMQAVYVAFSLGDVSG